MKTISSLFAVLVLAARISSPEKGIAAQSAEDLLAEAEKTLLNTRGFVVDYSVQPEASPGWPGVALKGTLVLQGESQCFFTNNGALSIIPAVLTIVSDEKSHMLIHSRGVEWVPERPGPINLKQIAGWLPRAGISSVVVWAVADIMHKTQPDPESVNRMPPLAGAGLKITEAQGLGKEQMPNGSAHHIRFGLAIGTNEAERVELWLDEKSGLPVKRVFHSRESGDVMTETYSFRLNPTLAPSFFDPRRVAREMKFEAQIIASEKPTGRLLRGALWADQDLVRQALKAGADPNARTLVIGGEPGPELSALMLACMSGDQSIIELLAGSGAEINARAPSGATALNFAVIYHHPRIVDWLRSHGGKEGKLGP